MTDGPEITFIEHLAPALGPGVYDIHVSTTVSHPTLIPAEDVAETRESIYVGGDRFRLDPANVDSVHPPDLGVGSFHETLPHVVFRSPGIPWSRDPFGPDGAPAGAPKTTWLALLLFDQDDPAPTPKTMPIGEVVTESSGHGVWFPSPFAPGPGEDFAAPCTVIDVPRRLFDAIKPTTADLRYLAHARRVDVTFKPDFDRKAHAPERDYAVVVGHRLPRMRRESVVHLVSLEGYAPILDEDAYGNAHSVRLVSLRSWRFTCEDTGGSLSEHVARLNAEADDDTSRLSARPILLRHPAGEPSASNGDAQKFFAQGYVPMPHLFRQGRRSVSWYRGPLTPLPVKPFVPVPAPSADALLLYDPDLGFFDVAYAAAWQLGRLLALRNARFARAQYLWKQKVSVDARKTRERELLDQKLPHLPHDADGLVHLNAVLDGLGDVKGDAAPKSTGGLAAEDGPVTYTPDTASDWFDTIQRYVRELKALRDVPYHYLVPVPEIVPRESLRFFHVDPNWVSALVDGAFSVGDVLREDVERKRALVAHDALAEHREAVTYTGFILRSSLLQIWPGIELRAFASGRDAPIAFVRNDRLREDVLVCLVEGPIAMLEIRAPPEALHFGVTMRSDPDERVVKFAKAIRKKDGSGDLHTLDDVATSDARVVDIGALAESMRAAPGASQVFDAEFTAADFGYVMVKTVDGVRIDLEGAVA